MVEQYELYREDLFEQFEDQQWFSLCVAWNYNRIGKLFQCRPIVTPRYLTHVHDYYHADLERSLDHGTPDETVELDHFKHAAFLCFWLRRINPIHDIQFLASLGERRAWEEAAQIPETTKWDIFSNYGNEICAFEFGLRIALFFEKFAQSTSPDVISIAGRTEVPKGLGADFLETAKMLRHKNMSPHAIYLLYKSICRPRYIAHTD